MAIPRLLYPWICFGDHRVPCTHTTSPLSTLSFLHIYWSRTEIRRDVCDNQQISQRISNYRFASNYSKNATRDNTYLFDDIISLYRTKTRPRSSTTTRRIQPPLFAKFRPTQTSFTLDIDASIVGVIIGDMFFHPDDHDSTSHTNALRLFKRDNNTGKYKVTRDTSLQFDLIVDFIAADLSFRQVESILNGFKDRTGLAKIGCINDTEIANNARVFYGTNMQMTSQILSSSHKCTWTFSLANDDSTHYKHSYFNNRIRIHHNDDVFNLHLLAIHMFERHTVENVQPYLQRSWHLLSDMRIQVSWCWLGWCIHDDWFSPRCRNITWITSRVSDIPCFMWTTSARSRYEGCV